MCSHDVCVCVWVGFVWDGGEEAKMSPKKAHRTGWLTIGHLPGTASNYRRFGESGMAVRTWRVTGVSAPVFNISVDMFVSGFHDINFLSLQLINLLPSFLVTKRKFTFPQVNLFSPAAGLPEAEGNRKRTD